MENKEIEAPTAIQELLIPTTEGELVIPTSGGMLKKLVQPINLQWSILAKLFFIGTPLCLFTLLGLMAYITPLHSFFFLPTSYLIIIETVAALGLTGYLWFVWLFRVPAEDCVSWMIKKSDEKD